MKVLLLTRGFSALVDDDDYEWLSKWKWSTTIMRTSGPYAIRGTRSGGINKNYLMHREILINKYGRKKFNKRMLCDHIDGNGLNNCKSNLRIATKTQNNGYRGKSKNNTSGYIGVIFDRKAAKATPWRAEIVHKNKNLYIGRFSDPISAALARDKKALELRGKFAFLNFK